ncbi:unnamed protein product [Chondrus crispus]|uniref:Uncharacterized protein n=1 Tax=Chondrus crispus TaxID=2769 RepID=R7Q9K3_CHOCR|nr:unnamed protein product [Chondrus crispus]CDF34739.1 unnamed protein product [Chondrus crispus]|eukprot:XP_005714558.1 unnamed protein product [Chondrus crispus]
MLQRPSLPPIAEVAAPELRLAGFRINANTYAPSRADYYVGMSMQRVDDPNRTTLPISGLPPPPSRTAFLEMGYVRWAPDGSRFAFCIYDHLFGLELWVVNVDTRRAECVLPGIRLNAVCGEPFTWSADSRNIIAKFVVEDRRAPEMSPVPVGPVVQENTSSKPAPSRTFQDLLRSRYDVKLFEHYTTCQLGLVDTDAFEMRPLGAPAAFRRASPSPDGTYLLIDAMVPPYAYMMPAGRFPRKIEVWDAASGEIACVVAEIPLQDKIPIAFDGVGEGPRGIGWRADSPATIYWAEAQDGGDPNVEADIRDCVFSLPAPFTGSPRKLASLAWRYSGIIWGSETVALISERRYKTRSARSYLNWEDRYNDAGSVCTTRNAAGKGVMRLIYPSGRKAEAGAEAGGSTDVGRPFLMLQGAGASKDGDRPFLSLFDTVTGAKTKLWESSPPMLESVAAVLKEDAGTGAPREVLVRRESPKENPNFFVVDVRKAAERVAVPAAGVLAGAGRAATGVHVGVPARVQVCAVCRADARVAVPVCAAGADAAVLADARVRDPGRARDGDRGVGGGRGQRHVRGAAGAERGGGGGVPGAARGGRPRAHGDRRALVRGVHDGQPAGARTGAVLLRGGAVRGVQPDADAVRVPERGADAVGGAARVRADVAVHVRRPRAEAAAADARRRRPERRHVPHAERAPLPGAQGTRKGVPVRVPAARGARVPREGVGAACARRNDRLARPVLQGLTARAAADLSPLRYRWGRRVWVGRRVACWLSVFGAVGEIQVQKAKCKGG